MIFYTEGRKWKNVSIASRDGKKVIAKFVNNKFVTDDNSLISLLSNKDKYPFIKGLEYNKTKDELDELKAKDNEIARLKEELEKASKAPVPAIKPTKAKPAKKNIETMKENLKK